jgi:hypothetical protein
VQVQQQWPSPPSSPKLAAQQDDAALPLLPPPLASAAAAPRQHRAFIMPTATSIPNAPEAPAAELQDDDFFAAAG